MKKQIIYQVLTRSVGDGKFSWWTEERFESLKRLGVSWIWYTGIPRHATDEPFVKGDPGSPYAVSDWYDINPYLADCPESRISEFRSLVERTHAAGLKVIVDFIPNHIACNYSDACGSIPCYSWCDYDWTDTRKVNWSDPRTVPVMAEVLRFWCGLGVDGFRCDMVELVDSEMFRRLTSAVRSGYPDTLFVAEVYQPANYRRYLDAGFDLLYDKSGSYDTLRSILTGRADAGALTGVWQGLGDIQPRMLNFLENHDEQRLASSAYLGCPERAYAALAWSVLFNTSSFMLYAGQECGESAPGSSDGRSSIFNWDKVDTDRPLKKYVDVLSLASTPLFAEGSNWDLQYCNFGNPDFDTARQFAFLRYLDRKIALVVCNFSSTGVDVRVNIPDDALSAAGISRKELDSKFKEILHIEANDYLIIKSFKISHLKK